MTKIKYERGSEWRKWDLHTHTKGTQKNDNFTSLSFDKFCKKMLLEAIDNQIQVIGITDYFNLDNYLKLKSYIQEIDKNNVTRAYAWNDVFRLRASNFCAEMFRTTVGILHVSPRYRTNSASPLLSFPRNP